MADINPNLGSPQRPEDEAHEGEFCEIQPGATASQQETTLGQEIRETTSQVLQQGKDMAASLGEQGKQMAGQLTGRGKGKASELANQIQVKISDLLEQQKHMAADRLGAIANMLRDFSNSLQQEENSKSVAPYADKTADRIERISHNLHEQDLRDIIDRAKDYARRQPEIFLGASFVGGLLLARFLKTTWSHGSSQISREPTDLAADQASQQPTSYGAWESEKPDIEGSRTGTRDYSVNDPATDANVSESSTGEPDDAQL
jgi:hypothetical protein